MQHTPPSHPPTTNTSTLRTAAPIWKNWYQINFHQMPGQYIHHVHSRPIKVSDDVWRRWYVEERSRDMVHFGVSETAAFYRGLTGLMRYVPEGMEEGEGGDGDGVGEMEYLALYQMGKTIPRYLPSYQNNVRIKSALWDAQQTCFQVAQFASDHLELVEILGSYAHTDAVAPYIVHAKIVGEEVESKLQFEHVNVVSRVEGYRRSLLYRSVGEVRGLPYVVLIHEFDEEPGGLEGVKGGMEGIEQSRDCAFQLRAYGLVESEGFGGSHRKPERLPDEKA